MIIVWSQICKHAVANLLHLSGKYGGVKATRETTESRESLQGNDCPLDPIKSRRRAARLSTLQQLRCWIGVIFLRRKTDSVEGFILMNLRPSVPWLP